MSDKTTTHGKLPAFPALPDWAMLIAMSEDNAIAEQAKVLCGLTKRELFAVTALNGLLSSEPRDQGDECEARCSWLQQVARDRAIAAVAYADALLEQLNEVKS